MPAVTADGRTIVAVSWSRKGVGREGLRDGGFLGVFVRVVVEGSCLGGGEECRGGNGKVGKRSTI